MFKSVSRRASKESEKVEFKFEFHASQDDFVASRRHISLESIDLPLPGETEAHETLKDYGVSDIASASLPVRANMENEEPNSTMNKPENSKPLNSATTGVGSKPPTPCGENKMMLAHTPRPQNDVIGRHGKDSSEMLRWLSQHKVSHRSLPFGSDRSSAQSHRRSNSLSLSLDVAETTPEGLDRDAASWQQHSQKASNETETLKQQLTAEMNRALEMAVELSALRTELESIRIESEHLKSTRRASQDKENAQQKTHLEVKDAKNKIKELQEELAYEKSMNISLELQLQKTNESNTELLLEIQDLEESLQKRHKEIEELTAECCLMKDREKDGSLEDMKAGWIQKLQVAEKEIQQLTEKIKSLEAMERKETNEDENEPIRTLGLLKKDLDELERDSQELTEENFNLLLQLKAANEQIHAKGSLIAQMESKLALISDQSLMKTISDKVTVPPGSLDIQAENLRAMVVDLKENLCLREEMCQSEAGNSRTLLDELNSLMIAVQSKYTHFETQLECSEDKCTSLMNELDTLKKVISEHEKERALLASQRGQLKSLREKLAKVTQDYESVWNRSNNLELAHASLREESNQVVDKLQHELESKEEKLQKTFDSCTNLQKRMAETEAENVRMHEQMSSLLATRDKAEASMEALERSKTELQEELKHAEQNNSKELHRLHECEAEIANLLRDIATAEGQLKDMNLKLSDAETTREILEKRLQDIEQENQLHQIKIKELERQASGLLEDNKSMKESLEAFESKAWKLQSENTDLTEKLRAVVANSHRTMGEPESHHTKFKITNCLLSQSDLERKHGNVQNQVENVNKDWPGQQEEYVNDLEARCRLAQQQKEDMRNEKKELEAALQYVIKHQEEEIKQAQSELTEVREEADYHKRIICELETLIQNLEHASITLSGGNIKGTTTSASKITLNAEMEKFHSEGKDQETEVHGEIKALHNQPEEMHKRNQKEESILIESLQQELQDINLQKSSISQKGKLTTQALSMVPQDMAENVRLQQELVNMQKIVIRANAEAMSLKKDIDCRVEEANKQGVETGKRLEETLQELNHIKVEKTICDKKVAELEEKLTLFENEKKHCAEEKENSKNILQHCEHLQAELEASKTALHEMKLEKIWLETSLQKLNIQNATLLEELAHLKDTAKANEEAIGRLKISKVAVDNQNAKGAKRALELEQRNELIRLRKQVTELKRKLSEQEENKEESKKKLFSLEEELHRKTALLSFTEKKLKEKEREERFSNGGNHPSTTARSMSRANNKGGPLSNAPPSLDAKDFSDRKDKLKLLEDELKIKSVELEATKYVLREKEAELCNKAEHLRLEKGNSTEDDTTHHLDQLQKELNRLQDQNAELLSRIGSQEQELLYRIDSQEALQNEIGRLRKENQELDNTLSNLCGATNGSNTLERADTLNGLSKALEANNMSEYEFQSASAHTAAVENLMNADKVMDELAELKRKNAQLEDELKELRDRYSGMSLQFAEVEAQREELVLAMRTINRS